MDLWHTGREPNRGKGEGKSLKSSVCGGGGGTVKCHIHIPSGFEECDHHVLQMDCAHTYRGPTDAESVKG